MAGDLLRTRVWIEHGYALLISNRLPDALGTFEKAMPIVGKDPALMLPAVN